MKVLILCTGNSCRSQMAEGFLKQLHPALQVWSAGTNPAAAVHPLAIQVMKEAGIDISLGYPKSADMFASVDLDYVITVCGGAQENCPVFNGKVKHRLHIGFDDPAEVIGTEEEVLNVFRRVRDEIQRDFSSFFENNLKTRLEEARLKAIVLEKYSAIAAAGGCCCESPADVDYSIFSESYDQLKGYNPDADMGLGCGIPTEFAGIKPGDTVLDLGSGAGNDCFVARAETGEKGRVIGLDFSKEMLDKARKNAEKLSLKNVEFVEGDIDNMPLQDATIDVIISNCVLNLVPSKEKAFSEMMRVLKNDGHFCVSDVVLIGELPDALRQDAVLYAGCVSGALQKDDYLAIIKKAGFKNVKIHKEKQVSLPDELLQKYLGTDAIEKYKKSESGIFSISVSGNK